MKIHHPQQTDVQAAELKRTTSDKGKKNKKHKQNTGTDKTSPVAFILSSTTENLHRQEQKQHKQVFLACNLCKNTLCKTLTFMINYFSLPLTM